MDDPGETAILLRRWHAGEQGALQELLQRDLGWIREHVQRRLGGLLRQKGETQDYVQDAMVEVLRYGPRFVMHDRDRFRGLLVRIIENVLRDRHDWFTAKRRAIQRERPLPDDSVIDLDLSLESVTRPSEHAARGERESWVRLALELLPPDDRRVILLRQWDELPFEEIGARLGCSTDAARMRFQRALPKLARKIEELRAGGGLANLGSEELP
ncbi:MAG: sigma-70 family RNA polymerase sigma factor [Planctomycetes bacterium]|nr:sigma-70 family RNA polymerase sigma factor [Planctomycetota bacterium]